MRLVKIVGDEDVAKLLSDPMRRAILNILREGAMSEVQLAKRLGLTDASVNYHLTILRRARLLVVARKEVGDHGIVQKFYLPSAYLYLADIERLPLGAARYYLPINIERMRGALSSCRSEGLWSAHGSGSRIDEMGEELARILVEVARSHTDEDVEPGAGEPSVNKIYTEAFERLLRKRFGR